VEGKTGPEAITELNTAITNTLKETEVKQKREWKKTGVVRTKTDKERQLLEEERQWRKVAQEKELHVNKIRKLVKEAKIRIIRKMKGDIIEDMTRGEEEMKADGDNARQQAWESLLILEKVRRLRKERAEIARIESKKM
jgi:hypothetical protein